MTPLIIHKPTLADTTIHAQFFTLLKKEFAEIPWLTEEILASGETHALLNGTELIGGVTLFAHAPETSEILKEVGVRLNGRPAIFASCFVITEEHKKKGYGLFLAKKVLEEEIFAKGKVAWGIFQKSELANFYKKHFDCEIYQLPSNLNLIIFTNISSAAN